MANSSQNDSATLLLSPSEIGAFRPPPQDPSRSNDGVELRLLLGAPTGNLVTVMFGTIAPGGEISRETHEAWSETIFVVAGVASCRVGDEVTPTRVASRQLWHVRKGHSHIVRNDEATDLEFLILFGV